MQWLHGKSSLLVTVVGWTTLYRAVAGLARLALVLQSFTGSLLFVSGQRLVHGNSLSATTHQQLQDVHGQRQVDNYTAFPIERRHELYIYHNNIVSVVVAFPCFNSLLSSVVFSSLWFVNSVVFNPLFCKRIRVRPATTVAFWCYLKRWTWW